MTHGHSNPQSRGDGFAGRILSQGFNMTLMQPSCFSRNVSRIPAPSSSFTVCVITNKGSIRPCDKPPT